MMDSYTENPLAAVVVAAKHMGNLLRATGMHEISSLLFQ